MFLAAKLENKTAEQDSTLRFVNVCIYVRQNNVALTYLLHFSLAFPTLVLLNVID